MELDEFVTATLVGISEGVEEASKQLKDSTTIINPRNMSFKPVVMMTGFSGSGLAAIVGTFIALGSFRLYSNESE